MCLALAGSALAAVCVTHGPVWATAVSASTPDQRAAVGDLPPTIAARVVGREITGQELREAMRDHLWGTGMEWAGLSADEENAVRSEVLDALVNECLIRAARVQDRPASSVPQAAVEEEHLMFVRQFHLDGDYERRLRVHGVTEAALKEQMREAAEDEAWVEAQIAARMKDPADAHVEAWLRENRATVALPARYGVAHIYLTTHDASKADREPEIRAIHRKLATGAGTFEKLAAEFSEDERTKKIGGELGWCARGRMPDDFMNAVEKLDEGETSEPVETRLGWHIIKLIEKKPGRMTTLAEVKSEVAAMLRNKRREAAIAALVAELRATAGTAVELNRDVLDSAEPAPMLSPVEVAVAVPRN